MEVFFLNKSGDENRSVRNTKKRIQDGLLTLLQKKQINKITVKELTELVDVNRGTFYFHYTDVYDLLYKTEESFFNEFNTVLNGNELKSSNDMYLYLVEIFSFLEKNANMCRIFFSENCDMKFFNNIKALVNERCFAFRRTSPEKNNDQRAALYNAFVVNGCVGLMKRWLEDDFAETPEEISQIVLDIITSGVDGMKTTKSGLE